MSSFQSLLLLSKRWTRLSKHASPQYEFAGDVDTDSGQSNDTCRPSTNGCQ